MTTKNVLYGSFKDFVAIGNHQLNSINRSTDGFIAQLDRDDFYNVNWARGFGFDGEDQTYSVVGWGHDEVVTGVLGEGNTTKSEFFPNGDAKMYFQLNKINNEGKLIDEVSFISNGRINNAHIVKSSSWEELVVAFEFERNLYWSEGEIRSNGEFDIFSTTVIFSFLIQIYSMGGAWNDRLVELCL